MTANDPTRIENDHVPRAMTCDECPTLKADIAWLKSRAETETTNRAEDRAWMDRRFQDVLDLIERRREHSGQTDIEVALLKQTAKLVTKHEQRISGLERWKSAVMAVAAIVSLIVSLLVRFAGQLIGHES